jgi:hypothetical protein
MQADGVNITGSLTAADRIVRNTVPCLNCPSILLPIQPNLVIVHFPDLSLGPCHLAVYVSSIRSTFSNPCCCFLLLFYQKFRGIVVDAVLSTDMAKHFKFVGDFRAGVNKVLVPPSPIGTHGDHSPLRDGLIALRSSLPVNLSAGPFAEDKSMFFDAIVHTADLAPPTKPWHLCQEWATRILRELFAQVNIWLLPLPRFYYAVVHLVIPHRQLCPLMHRQIVSIRLAFALFNPLCIVCILQRNTYIYICVSAVFLSSALIILLAFHMSGRPRETRGTRRWSV